jgi:predicted nucleic acid-binding protein
MPDCEVYINLVVEIEVLAKPDMDEREEAEARALLDCFLWAEIDKSTHNEAIRIRRGDKPLRLPDALIPASAVTFNTTILSNDPYLRSRARIKCHTFYSNYLRNKEIT